MSNVVVSPIEGLRPHSVIRESGSVKDIIYITVDGQQEFSVSKQPIKDAHIMRLNTATNCWDNEGQVQAGGAITKNRRSRIAKTRIHKSKNRMTKKHINGKKRGTRVKSMR